MLCKREEGNIEDDLGHGSEADQDRSELHRVLDSSMSLTIEKQHLGTSQTTIMWLLEKAMLSFSLFVTKAHWYQAPYLKLSGGRHLNLSGIRGDL